VDSTLATLDSLLLPIQSNPDSIQLKAHIYKAYGTAYTNSSQFGLAAAAQSKSIQYLLQYKDTSEVVNEYSLLAAFSFRLGEMEKARSLIDISLRHVSETESNLSKIYTRAATIYHQLGEKDSAKKYMQRGLSIARERKDSTSIAAALTNIGTTFHEEGNYPAALENYQAALKLSREQGYTSAMLPLLLNIGQIYHDQGDLDTALPKYKEAKLIAEKEDMKRYRLGATLGLVAIQLDRGNYEGLAEELEQQLQIARAVEDPSILLRTLNQKTELMLALDSLESALNTAEMAVDISNQQDEPHIKAVSYANMGHTLARVNNFVAANEMCIQSLAIAEPRGLGDVRLRAYNCLYVNAAAQNDYQSAYNYLTKYQLLSDSLLNSESIRKINNLILKSEYDEKMLVEQLKNEEYRQLKEIEIQSQRRVQLFTLGLLVLASISIVGIVIALRNKQKYTSSLEQLNLSLQQNQQQLAHTNRKLDQFAHSVSHDIINRLSKVALDARLNEEVEQTDALQAFRRRAEVTANNLINFCENLLGWSESTTTTKESVDLNSIVDKTLTEYSLLLETHGFEVKKDQLPAVVLPEVILEQLFANLIDNAIKHTQQEEKPCIEISTTQTDDSLVEIEVSDNGHGIDQNMLASIFSQNTKGRGLSFLQNTLNEYGLSIRAENNESGGASFYCTLPTVSRMR
jgi:signal transduction histidine kinase